MSANSKSLDQLLEGANSGNLEDMVRLAFAYREGDAVKQSDRQAFHWFEKAAKQSHTWAQFEVGVCYTSGDGVDKSPTQAFYWLKKAAEQGHAWAQNNLACCYSSGDGVEESQTQALYWFEKAAESGANDAMVTLSKFYSDSEDTPENNRLAGYWLRKAAESGHEEAKEKYDRQLAEIARELDAKVVNGQIIKQGEKTKMANYEYKTVSCPPDKEEDMLNFFAGLGWEPVGSETITSGGGGFAGVNVGHFTFGRVSQGTPSTTIKLARQKDHPDYQQIKRLSDQAEHSFKKYNSFRGLIKTPFGMSLKIYLIAILVMLAINTAIFFISNMNLFMLVLPIIPLATLIFHYPWCLIMSRAARQHYHNADDYREQCEALL